MSRLGALSAADRAGLEQRHAPLLRFEINVRAAAVIGFVGAGGIGQDLMEAIRKFYYTDISAMLVLIVGAVVIIDLVTEQLRHRLIGLERTR